MIKSKIFKPGIEFHKPSLLRAIFDEMRNQDGMMNTWYADNFARKYGENHFPTDIKEWLEENLNDRIIQNYINNHVRLAMQWGESSVSYRESWNTFLRKWFKELNLIERFTSDFKI